MNCGQEKQHLQTLLNDGLQGKVEEMAVAVPGLERALTDVHDDVRHAAVLALGYLGKEALPAVPALVRIVGTRSDVKDSLLKIGKEVPEMVWPQLKEKMLAKDLSRPWDTSRESAAEVLRDLGKEATALAVPELVRALDDSHEEAREGAALALSYLGKEALPAVPQLLRALDDSHEEVRKAAVAALGYTGIKVPEIVWPQCKTRLLETLMRDVSKDVRKAAAQTFGRITDSPTQADVILKIFGESSPEVCEAVAEAEFSAGLLNYNYEVWKLLVERLRKGNVLGRKRAAKALGYLCTTTRNEQSIQVLIPVVFKDSSGDVREAAAIALGKIGHKRWNRDNVVGKLVQYMADVPKDEVLAAVKALSRLGEEAPEVLDLIELPEV